MVTSARIWRAIRLRVVLVLVSFLAIPPVKESIEQMLVLMKKRMLDFKKNPPNPIAVMSAWIGDPRGGKEIAMPADFDAKTNEGSSKARMAFSYENEYEHQRYRREKNISQAKGDIKFLQERFDAWVAPKA